MLEGLNFWILWWSAGFGCEWFTAQGVFFVFLFSLNLNRVIAIRGDGVESAAF